MSLWQFLNLCPGIDKKAALAENVRHFTNRPVQARSRPARVARVAPSISTAAGPVAGSSAVVVSFSARDARFERVVAGVSGVAVQKGENRRERKGGTGVQPPGNRAGTGVPTGRPASPADDLYLPRSASGPARQCAQGHGP